MRAAHALLAPEGSYLGLVDSELLELESRAELKHVLACADCYVFDSYDGGGPNFCLDFQAEFRGLILDEACNLPPALGQQLMELWGPVVLTQLRPILRFETLAAERTPEDDAETS